MGSNVINLVPYRPVCLVPEQKRYMLHYVPFRPIYRSVPAVPVSSGRFPDLVRNINERFREEEDEEKRKREAVPRLSALDDRPWLLLLWKKDDEQE